MGREAAKKEAEEVAVAKAAAVKGGLASTECARVFLTVYSEVVIGRKH